MAALLSIRRAKLVRRYLTSPNLSASGAGVLFHGVLFHLQFRMSQPNLSTQMASYPETLHNWIRQHIRAIEMVGVLMRIFSFTLVSWLGPKSPFLFVWIFNTADAIMLAWCSALKRDHAYTLLNAFWILIGAMGIARSLGFLQP